MIITKSIGIVISLAWIP